MDFFQISPKDNQLHIAEEAAACASVLMACFRSNELGTEASNPAFKAIIGNRNIFKGHDPAVLIDQAAGYYEQAGGSAALIDAAIDAIREQTRLPLFYTCLDLILADGVVTPQEHKIFQYLKGKFHIEDEHAWTAMEVLVAKNML